MSLARRWVRENPRALGAVVFRVSLWFDTAPGPGVQGPRPVLHKAQTDDLEETTHGDVDSERKDGVC